MSEPYENDGPRGIRSWAEDDRPREKMLLKGRMALSDAELIAILLGSGSRNETAVDLAKRVLASTGNDLTSLGRLDLKDLMKFKGIGEAKAISVAAALELGRRRKEAAPPKRIQLRSSAEAYEHILPYMADLKHEEFWVILLDRAHHPMGTQQVSKGGVTSTVVDAKLVFRPAIEMLASGVILCHNHPSGNLNPSNDDIELTRKLVQAGDALDIRVVDHLIVADSDYYSFQDHKKIRSN
jgi:DNA repair protein RadC